MNLPSALSASTKQYVTAIKKHLNISQAGAMDLVARSHDVANWHEFSVLQKTNPLDVRVLAAALSRRSPPSLKTDSIVRAAIKSLGKFCELSGVPGSAGIWLSAKGFKSTEDLTPASHLEYEQICEAQAFHDPALRKASKLNLFDIASRQVFITGMSGTGKSVAAMAMAEAHLAQGGTVTCVNNQSSRDTKWKGVPLMMKSIESQFNGLNVSPRFRTIRECGPDDFVDEQAVKSYFKEIHAGLLPFSLVIFDEFEILSRATQGVINAFQRELQDIRAAGNCVIFVSQDSPYLYDFDETLFAKTSLIMFFACSPRVTNNSVPEPLRTLISEVMVKRNEYTSCLVVDAMNHQFGIAKMAWRDRAE